MCSRKCGSNEPIGEKTPEELKNYRLRLFTLMINIYKITQNNHDNNWLFEWKENKVLKNAGIWQKLFIKSFKTDFDYNGRWANFQKHIGTDDANKQSKKPFTTGKRKLPMSSNSSDAKGDLVSMKKKETSEKS